MRSFGGVYTEQGECAQVDKENGDFKIIIM